MSFSVLKHKITRNIVNLGKTKELFLLYIWFSFLFFSIAFFWGGGQKFRDITSWHILILRDCVWFGFLLYMGIKVKMSNYFSQLWKSEYGRFLKVFVCLGGIYFVIVLTHLTHRDFREVVQHDLRNILSYSLILPFLPFIFKKKEDLNSLINTFLQIGMVLSLFGIVTRYVAPDLFSWNGRITATMGDPNNLALFLSLCLFILISRWRSLGSLKSVVYFIIYSFAFVLSNSIVAFGTFFLGLIVLLVLKTKLLKSIAIFILIFYVLISFSFLTKMIENPEVPLGHIATTTYDADWYLIDKLNNISKGRFSNFFLFGMNFPSDAPISSLTHRLDQIEYMNSRDINYMVFLFGNFELKEYARFDNQYFNFFVNAGVISAIIFSGFFMWGVLLGVKNYFYLKKTGKDSDLLSLPLSVFLLAVVLVGFNGTAFLNRFPINFLLYLSLGIIFLEKDMIKRD